MEASWGSDLTNSAKSVSSKTVVLGGSPPDAESPDSTAFAKWAESVPEHPMPVKSELKELYTLLAADRRPLMTKQQYQHGIAVYAAHVRRQMEEAERKRPRTSLKVGEQLRSDDQLEKNRVMFSADGGTRLELHQGGRLSLSSNGQELWVVYPPKQIKGNELRGPFVLSWNNQMSLVLKGSLATPYWVADVSPDWCGGASPSQLVLRKHGEAHILTSLG